MNLKNSSCVVTGAARGLGAALARELAGRDARVVISDIDGADLQDIGIELEMPTMHCDVTDREQVEALARAALEEHGEIDIWINNAGIWMPYMKAEELDLNRAHRLIEVNYFGVAHGMLEAMKHMTPRGQGAIVNILSVRALKGKALGAAYSASKFAAEGFMQSVRDEISGGGISIIGVYPYRMKTELFGDNKHEDYGTSMEATDVARIIVDNLAASAVAEHLEIWSADDIRKVGV